jgi:hypothetical protein
MLFFILFSEFIREFLSFKKIKGILSFCGTKMIHYNFLVVCETLLQLKVCENITNCMDRLERIICNFSLKIYLAFKINNVFEINILMIFITHNL